MHLAVACLLVVGYPILVLVGLFVATCALYRGHWRPVVYAVYGMLAAAWVGAMVFVGAETVPFLAGTFGIGVLGSCLYLACRRRSPARSSPARPEPVLVATPATGPVRPQDLVGDWCFYLDAVASTVKMEFRPDGTFAETLVSNRGERTECPGGTWALDGPRVELTGYRSAVAGTIEHVWWFFGDTPAGLRLFGKDRPSLQGPFRVSRVDPETAAPG